MVVRGGVFLSSVSSMVGMEKVKDILDMVFWRGAKINFFTSIILIKRDSLSYRTATIPYLFVTSISSTIHYHYYDDDNN